MKKNWIVWKRTLGASLCELFCPVVLMAIIAIARLLVKSSEVEPQSNTYKSVLMAPMVYPNLTRFNITGNSSANLFFGIARVNATYATFAGQYGLFANFTNTSTITQNPLAKFLPMHCAKKRLDAPTPIIGVAGPPKYVEPIVRDLNALSKIYL